MVSQKKAGRASPAKLSRNRKQPRSKGLAPGRRSGHAPEKNLAATAALGGMTVPARIMPHRNSSW